MPVPLEYPQNTLPLSQQLTASKKGEPRGGCTAAANGVFAEKRKKGFWKNSKQFQEFDAPWLPPSNHLPRKARCLLLQSNSHTRPSHCSRSEEKPVAAGTETVCARGEDCPSGEETQKQAGAGVPGVPQGGTYTFSFRPVVLSWGTCASSTTQSFSEGCSTADGSKGIHF